MKFTLSWLKRFLDTECNAQEIGQHLTSLGLELEELINNSEIYKPFIVAEIKSAEKHPDADSLKLCQVFDGAQTLQIVCGAPNAREGIKVALAPVGAIIPNGGFKIKASKIRGIASNGMMCSENELGISDEHNGIIELPDSAELGKNIAQYYGLDDPIFEIAITPNRADCLGVYGIARDLAAKGVGVLKNPDIQEGTPSFDTKLKIQNDIQNVCPLFTAFEIKDIQNHESPLWLKFLLNNVGCNSVSSLVDITNYICLSFGQPMHSYDAESTGCLLHIAYGTEGAEFEALNDKTYKLSSDDIIVNDAHHPSCIAGVMGSHRSACSDKTKSAYIECALFDKVKVSKTGRRLMIDSDSRYRFERGVDPLFTINAAKIAATMFKEITGAKISNIIVNGKVDQTIPTIEFDPKLIEKRLGLKIEYSQVVEILTSLGIKSTRQGDMILVSVPSWRGDITIAEDLVEEIARLYGYDNLPMIELKREAVGCLSIKQRRVQDSKHILASFGYNEVVSWSFMDSRKAAAFMKDGKISDDLRLSNPISDVLDYMRPSIIGNLLQMVQKNIARNYNDLALFEVGPIFKGGLASNIDTYGEIDVISGVRSGSFTKKNIHNPQRDIDIYDVKADVENLLAQLGVAVSKCRVDTTDIPAYYHPGRTAKLMLGKNMLAIFGEIHPSILQEFDVKQAVSGFEIMIDSLPVSKPKKGARPSWNPSDFQSVSRDFAFVMAADIAVGEVLNSVASIDKKLIRDVTLFDVYQGEHIDAGKKSVAFNIVIQSNDATLSETQIVEIVSKVENIMLEKFNAVIRG